MEKQTEYKTSGRNKVVRATTEERVYDLFPHKKEFTMFSNIVLDYIHPILTGSEWSVYCFLIRKIEGHQNKNGWDKISYSQYQKGTVCKSTATIAKALKGLEEKGLVFRERESITETMNYHIDTRARVAVGENGGVRILSYFRF